MFRNRPKITSDAVWPCEGLICDCGRISDFTITTIKGQRYNVLSIYGKNNDEIPDHYHFANIFLHNSNYHRIHSPVSAKITRIEHVPGDLVLLRPWAYKTAPSLPAFRNERINVDLVPETGEPWYVSIVGGPTVGLIAVRPEITLESPLTIGDEIATFLLGSTCCIACPKRLDIFSVGDSIRVGDAI